MDHTLGLLQGCQDSCKHRGVKAVIYPTLTLHKLCSRRRLNQVQYQASHSGSGIHCGSAQICRILILMREGFGKGLVTLSQEKHHLWCTSQAPNSWVYKKQQEAEKPPLCLWPCVLWLCLFLPLLVLYLRIYLSACKYIYMYIFPPGKNGECE